MNGTTVHVAQDAAGDFSVVHSVGHGFGFSRRQLDAFVSSNAFGSRLADALTRLTLGEAIAIRARTLRIVVCRAKDNQATIRRTFRLRREIM